MQLQREYGLPVDTIPYWKSVENRRLGGIKGGRRNVESGHLANIRKSGGQKKGCNNDHLRVLTDEQEAEIRAKYIPRKYSTYKLAKEYGVAHGTIHYIIKKG